MSVVLYVVHDTDVYIAMRSVACKEFFGKALFVVGELGWNDYGVMLVGGKSVAEAQSYVPRIVGTIVAATEVRTVEL